MADFDDHEPPEQRARLTVLPDPVPGVTHAGTDPVVLDVICEVLGLDRNSAPDVAQAKTYAAEALEVVRHRQLGKIGAALEARLTGGQTDRFHRWAMAEMFALDSTFQWDVRGMLTRSTYGMLAGGEKTLKTYIATFIYLGIAAGVPIFRHFKVDRSGPVLPFVGEGGQMPWFRRAQRVAACMGVSLRDVDIFPTFEIGAIGSQDFVASLRRDLDQYNPVLVGIDPYYSYHSTAVNSSNLHDEGANLAALSSLCVVEHDTTLWINNHFNQTGQGVSLHRITQAGAAEWCDSWMLVSHRRPPKVDTGDFGLRVEIGSRQWGGSSWDLDLHLGRFDPDLGDFDGAISFELRRATDADERAAFEDQAVAFVRGHPWQFTQRELSKNKGLVQIRETVAKQWIEELVANGRLVETQATRKGGNGATRSVAVLGVPSDSASAPQSMDDDEPF